MTIIRITASASAGFNHPFEQFANFKPSITLEADVSPFESPDLCARTLQTKAQDLVDAERARIEAECQHEQDVDNAKSEVDRWDSIVTSYERTIATMPNRLAMEPDKSQMSQWDRDRGEEALKEAQDNIEEARTKLAEAKAKLAAL